MLDRLPHSESELVSAGPHPDIPKNVKLERFLKKFPRALARMIVGWLEFYAEGYFNDIRLKQIVVEAVDTGMNTINIILDGKIINGEVMQRLEVFSPSRVRDPRQTQTQHLSTEAKARLEVFFRSFKENLTPTISGVAEMYAAARHPDVQSRQESLFKQTVMKELVAAMKQVDLIVGRAN